MSVSTHLNIYNGKCISISCFGTNLKNYHTGKLVVGIHLNYEVLVGEGGIQRPGVSMLDHHVGKIIVLVSVSQIWTFKKGKNIVQILLLPYVMPGKSECIREEDIWKY